MKDLKPILRYLYPCRREFILAILLLFVECSMPAEKNGVDFLFNTISVIQILN